MGLARTCLPRADLGGELMEMGLWGVGAVGGAGMVYYISVVYVPGLF